MGVIHQWNISKWVRWQPIPLKHNGCAPPAGGGVQPLIDLYQLIGKKKTCHLHFNCVINWSHG